MNNYRVTIQSLQQRISMMEDDHTHTVLGLKKQLAEAKTKMNGIAASRDFEVDGLNDKIKELEAENARLKGKVEMLEEETARMENIMITDLRITSGKSRELCIKAMKWANWKIHDAKRWLMNHGNI